MKKRNLLLKILLCILGVVTALLCIGCDCKDEEPYDPRDVDDTVIESTRTDGIKYVADDLGGEGYLYRVKASDLGILPDTGENVATQIQEALDNLSSQHKGGLLYLEKGVYRIGNQITLPVNTGICGDWIAPVGDNMSKIVSGTVIDVMCDAGKDSEHRGDAAIITHGNNVIKGITFAYSDQKPNGPKKYPYTIANYANTGFYVENVTFVNSYRGILLDDQNVFTLKNIYMTALHQGIKINYCYDIPELYNINISYKYWANAGVAFKAPSEATAKNLTRQADGFHFGRVDWLYLDTTMVEGYKFAYYFYRNESLSADIKEANGQFLYAKSVDCQNGLYVDTSSAIGNMFTNCSFNTTGTGSSSAYFSGNVSLDSVGASTYTTGYQFNNCTFENTGGTCVQTDGQVAVNFTNCSFRSDTSEVKANYGNLILDTCSFANCPQNIGVASTVQTIKIINCTYQGSKNISNGLSGQQDASSRYIEKNEQYSAQVAKLSTQRYTPEEISEPTCKNIYYADEYGAVADGNLLGEGTDNSVAIQHALNAAGSNGGGYVVLEGGYFRVDKNLIIPSGVHLIGNGIANRHFKDRSSFTTLVTTFGKDKEKTDDAFITMDDDSALRQMCVYYVDQDCASPVKYSPTVAVSGDNTQIERTIFIASYINFYVTGENAHISYGRGLGLSAGFIAEGIESGNFDYMFFSINDWMRTGSNDVPNAPPSGWHNRYPNFDNDTFVFENCKNVTVYHSFSYGQGTGLRLEGEVSNFRGIGMGVDVASNAIIMNNSGSGNVFINTQFAAKTNNIKTGSSYSASTTFYVSSCWFSGGSLVNSTFEGNGTVNIQQFKVQKGVFTPISGTVNLQGLMMDSPVGPHVDVQGSATGGVINSLGSSRGFETYLTNKFKMNNCTKRVYI